MVAVVATTTMLARRQRTRITATVLTVASSLSSTSSIRKGGKHRVATRHFGSVSAVRRQHRSLSLFLSLFAVPQIPPLLRGKSHLHRCDLRLRFFHLALLLALFAFGPATRVSMPRRRTLYSSTLLELELSSRFPVRCTILLVQLYRPSMGTARNDLAKCRGKGARGEALINVRERQGCDSRWMKVWCWRLQEAT